MCIEHDDVTGLRTQNMNHIGLVALKAQIMRFIVQSILLQRYRRWDILIYNIMGRFYANYMAGVKSSHYDCSHTVTRRSYYVIMIIDIHHTQESCSTSVTLDLMHIKPLPRSSMSQAYHIQERIRGVDLALWDHSWCRNNLQRCQG